MAHSPKVTRKVIRKVSDKPVGILQYLAFRLQVGSLRIVLYVSCIKPILNTPRRLSFVKIRARPPFTKLFSLTRRYPSYGHNQHPVGATRRQSRTSVRPLSSWRFEYERGNTKNAPVGKRTMGTQKHSPDSERMDASLFNKICPCILEIVRHYVRYSAHLVVAQFPARPGNLRPSDYPNQTVLNHITLLPPFMTRWPDNGRLGLSGVHGSLGRSSEMQSSQVVASSTYNFKRRRILDAHCDVSGAEPDAHGASDGFVKHGIVSHPTFPVVLDSVFGNPQDPQRDCGSPRLRVLIDKEEAVVKAILRASEAMKEGLGCSPWQFTSCPKYSLDPSQHHPKRGRRDRRAYARTNVITGVSSPSSNPSLASIITMYKRNDLKLTDRKSSKTDGLLQAKKSGRSSRSGNTEPTKAPTKDQVLHRTKPKYYHIGVQV
ncbi:hypothetical protein DFP72DRAFT_851271 [Ephemerocybe angulata]|uniref:Uncharacterized protein n=1 Tax=Ephemerocybe angulata TaxID=980116 RepID=A0A8H6M1K5_9AGAR|nr:hypothetical protein DFP72DRAFT_851271 [Tulosesus angulatus]